LRQAVADPDAMCESLKVDGRNPLGTQLSADRMLGLLGAGAKNDDRKALRRRDAGAVRAEPPQATLSTSSRQVV
jgi:hypothetical protein